MFLGLSYRPLRFFGWRKLSNIIKIIVQNIALTSVSVFIVLLVGDMSVRLFIDSVDYLQPELIVDEEYGHRIKPGSGGHDANGYRNNSVPDKISILAVGDSNTYGVSASSQQSWPSWLSKISGRSVYNAGLGGYGPVQYVKIIEELSKKLSPEIIVIGFYLGNDIMDANTYSGLLDSSSYKRSYVSNVEIPNNKNNYFVSLRQWMSENSMIYQMIKHSGSSFIDSLRFLERKSMPIGNKIMYNSDLIKTVFNPVKRLSAFDLNSKALQEGMGVSEKSLLRISAVCKSISSKCIILLIPTKELVYYSLIKNNLSRDDNISLGRVVNAELALKKVFISIAGKTGIEIYDPLDVMQAKALSGNIYPGHAGGHPNGRGYFSIASGLNERLFGGPH